MSGKNVYLIICSIFATNIQLHKFMSRHEKIIARLLSRPKDFAYAELVVLMNLLGYEEVKTGKTSGSRRAFISGKNKHIIRLHKPHPGSELRIYQIDYIIQELKKESLL
jgi:hypothetical protein